MTECPPFCSSPGSVLELTGKISKPLGDQSSRVSRLPMYPSFPCRKALRTVNIVHVGGDTVTSQCHCCISRDECFQFCKKPPNCPPKGAVPFCIPTSIPVAPILASISRCSQMIVLKKEKDGNRKELRCLAAGELSGVRHGVQSAEIACVSHRAPPTCTPPL